jgi:hypothetical protein
MSPQVHIYDPLTNNQTKTVSRFKDLAYSGSFKSDGKLLVAGGESGLVQVFDLGSRAILRTFRGHSAYVDTPLLSSPLSFYSSLLFSSLLFSFLLSPSSLLLTSFLHFTSFPFFTIFSSLVLSMSQSFHPTTFMCCQQEMTKWCHVGTFQLNNEYSPSLGTTITFELEPSTLQSLISGITISLLVLPSHFFPSVSLSPPLKKQDYYSLFRFFFELSSVSLLPPLISFRSSLSSL